MKAIETIYNGYRFRSRLEARWAVFFDAMGIKYEYEPEGFVFDDGTKYLPDFRIYVRHRSYEDEWEPVYVEVKGNMTPEDEHKVYKLAEHAPCIILMNLPANDSEYIETFLDTYCAHSFEYMDGDCYPALFSIYKGIPWICGPDHDEFDGGEAMNKALLKARQARFEHGEDGRTA